MPRPSTLHILRVQPAAWTPDRAALTVAVVNPAETEQALDLAFEGVDLTGSGMLWRMAPESLDARIVVGEEPEVAVEEEAIRQMPSRLLPPYSVSLYWQQAR